MNCAHRNGRVRSASVLRHCDRNVQKIKLNKTAIARIVISFVSFSPRGLDRFSSHAKSSRPSKIGSRDHTATRPRDFTFKHREHGPESSTVINGIRPFGAATRRDRSAFSFSFSFSGRVDRRERASTNNTRGQVCSEIPTGVAVKNTGRNVTRSTTSAFTFTSVRCFPVDGPRLPWYVQTRRLP